MEIAQDSDKLILALLINDFLTHMDLQYTANVFGHESNLKLKSEERDSHLTLLRSVGINPEDTGEPLLYQLLRKMSQKDSPTTAENPNLQLEKLEGNPEPRVPTRGFPKQPQETQNRNPLNMLPEPKATSFKSGNVGPSLNDPNRQPNLMMNNIQLNEFEQMQDPRAQLEDLEEGQEDPNQMYLSEPVALDVTADSDLLNEFDHAESLENYLYNNAPGSDKK